MFEEKKTILLINTGPTKKKFIIQKLKKLGVTLVVLHKEVNWADPYVDHWIVSDTFDHEESLSQIKKFLKNNPSIKLDGVLTFWEDDVLLTSKIVEQFNFIGIPYSIAKNVRNKYLFREFCLKNNIPAPRHHILRTKNDLSVLMKKYNFPLVVKPVFGSSSAYVVKVNTKEELISTIEYIKKNISTDVESALSDGTEILVEEYIDGDEVDIDILLQNGKIKFYCVSDNYNKSKEEFFVDSGQALPSGLPTENQNDLIALAEETLEKLGIQNGCIHFEAKSTKNGPVPIEVNMRMGGDYVYSYIKSAFGVDLIEGALSIALGKYLKIESPKEPKKYIVGWDLHPDFSGILVELNVDEELKKKEYLEEIHLYKEIGDAILLPPEGYESLGWLTVSGDNILDAQDNLKAALSYIQYKVVKYDEKSSLGKTARKTRLSSAVLNKSSLLGVARIEKIRRTSLETRNKLHIGIVGNSNQDREKKQLSTPQMIEKTLKERGYQVSLFDFNNPLQGFEAIRKSNVDFLFNAYEGIGNGLFKPQIAAMLEMLQIPFTGSSSLTLALSKDKIRMKKMFSYHHIPTPKWDYAYTLEDKINEDLKYPLIVKPGVASNSLGINQESIVINKRQLEKQLKKIIHWGIPALVEEYIEGDEYDIAILGNSKENIRVLPLTRSLFHKIPKGKWRIYSYDPKEMEKEYNNKILVQSPLKGVSTKLESLITEIALDAFNILHCQDYGRVEIRVDENDNPSVLRVNANPILSEKAFFYKSAALIGMQYGDLLEEIIDLTIKRYNENVPNYYFADLH